ncbi:hypothetical protein [Brevundimonas sp.]|uniref:hypothetical protein n=1 Tax=Brevundimonas sp. TaxID=1871086 RepID=UPI003D6CFC22
MWKPPLFVLIAFIAAGCSNGCGNNILANVASPNGNLSAVVFERSCGATTGYSTQVSVLPSGSLPSSAGNAFVADTDGRAAAFDASGAPWAEVVWVGDDRLTVRHDAEARVFTQNREVSGVQISYQAVER